MLWWKVIGFSLAVADDRVRVAACQKDVFHSVIYLVRAAISRVSVLTNGWEEECVKTQRGTLAAPWEYTRTAVMAQLRHVPW